MIDFLLGWGGRIILAILWTALIVWAVLDAKGLAIWFWIGAAVLALPTVVVLLIWAISSVGV